MCVCNHLCNIFYDLVDVVWPFLCVWSAAHDVWPYGLCTGSLYPWFILITGSVFSYWSPLPKNRPISSTKERSESCQIMSVSALWAPGNELFTLLRSWRSGFGGGMLCCSYWLELCVLWWWVLTSTILRLCDLSPPTLWPSAARNSRDVKHDGKYLFASSEMKRLQRVAAGGWAKLFVLVIFWH